ncbi:MAG TPA: polyprenol monophosphomannose synthase [Vicinamibacterales bacterium]|nr:polyprenol monophosphomannose synthase [Vicinamibacterales bacterium]
MNALVIIPTYNERENLPEIVPQVLRHDGVRVLVVDDGSPDGTGEVADRLAREHAGRLDVLHRTGRRGLGRSYVDGFRRALAMGVDVAVQMDADLSHDPVYLPAVLDGTARFDLAIGSRYVRGISVVNWPLKRLVLSTMANRYVRAVTALPIRDCTAGFRAWRRGALERLPLDRIVSDGYSFQVETLYEAWRAGCTIGEVPIVFVERREGESKLSKGVLLESLIMPWRLRLRGLSRK